MLGAEEATAIIAFIVWAAIGADEAGEKDDQTNE